MSDDYADPSILESYPRPVVHRRIDREHGEEDQMDKCERCESVDELCCEQMMKIKELEAKCAERFTAEQVREWIIMLGGVAYRIDVMDEECGLKAWAERQEKHYLDPNDPTTEL